MNIFRLQKPVFFRCRNNSHGPLLVPSMRAATPDEQAVLVPINAMFDGMAKRDAAAIKAPTLPGGTMVLMRDGQTSSDDI